MNSAPPFSFTRISKISTPLSFSRFDYIEGRQMKEACIWEMQPQLIAYNNLAVICFAQKIQAISTDKEAFIPTIIRLINVANHTHNGLDGAKQIILIAGRLFGHSKVRADMFGLIM